MSAFAAAFAAFLTLFVVVGFTFAFSLLGKLFLTIHRDGQDARRRLAADEFRQCQGCPTLYHASWDSPTYDPRKPKTGGKDFINGGLCPNCSGAS